jgi:hypothetical protein
MSKVAGMGGGGVEELGGGGGEQTRQMSIETQHLCCPPAERRQTAAHLHTLTMPPNTMFRMLSAPRLWGARWGTGGKGGEARGKARGGSAKPAMCRGGEGDERAVPLTRPVPHATSPTHTSFTPPTPTCSTGNGEREPQPTLRGPPCRRHQRPPGDQQLAPLCGQPATSQRPGS